VLASCVATLAGLVVTAPAAALAAVQSQAPPAGPTAVVALGDSTASGEGAGDCESGTRGESGNWCHRSANAYVHRTGLAERGINLACSGATSAEVGGGQADALVEVARTHRVTTVLMQLGANDDPQVTTVGRLCIQAWLQPWKPDCAPTEGPLWERRLAAMAPKVEAAVAAVRAAMGRAGYRDGDYSVVLASYASPVTENMVTAAGARGCPFRRADAAWARTVAVPALSATLREVAARSDARFLDLSRATEGNEACSRSQRSAEWQRRLTVNPEAYAFARLDTVGLHLAQESFHPNATAHGQFAGCLAEFVRGGSDTGQCLVGPDGNLHASVGQPVPA
jgi:lysophospholipase L1-like esterase